MKVLYIIAWVGLVLSVIVHAASLVGPDDVMEDIDAFVFILHGGCIFLGLPLILCAQKLVIATKEKDIWVAILKDCPGWMKKMVGFFFLYGIVNFILFIKSGMAAGGEDTPASVFRGFSGHWMIFYSLEVAALYSYLKKFGRDGAKASPDNQVIPMDSDSARQDELNLERLLAKRKKKYRIVKLFLIVGAVFGGLLWLCFKGYPWFLGCVMASLFPFVPVLMIYMLYSSWKMSSYLQKNHFRIWKKSKSRSFADNVEYQTFIRETDDPYLKLLKLKADRFSKILLWVWLTAAGLLCAGFVIWGPEPIVWK